MMPRNKNFIKANIRKAALSKERVTTQAQAEYIKNVFGFPGSTGQPT